MSPERSLDILIVGLNYAPEKVGIAVYTEGLAESLVARGHRVRVIAGKPYYPSWTVEEAFRGGWKRANVEKGVEVTRVRHYVPPQPTGARRILHHLSFAVNRRGNLTPYRHRMLTPVWGIDPTAAER
jgi:colanic acid biosynthesis glycosyl transferase WcaI